MRRQQWGEAELNWGLKTFFGWISCCPCPLSSFRAPMVKGGCPERLGQPGRKKKRNPRQVSQRVQTSEGGQSAVDAGGGAGLTGGWDLWPWCISWGSVSLALQTGVTSFTCDLLESCPSSSTGRLLNPAAGPSPDEPVAGEWRMEVEEARA